MNLYRLFRDRRTWATRHVVPLFGFDASDPEWWGAGTGFLVDFKGTIVVITCEHVVRRMTGGIFSVSREDGQTRRIDRKVHRNSTLDAAVIVTWPDMRFPLSVPDPSTHVDKKALSATRALLTSVDRDTAAYFTGFPTGHPRLYKGNSIDPIKKTAGFGAVTYFSSTGHDKNNSELNRKQKSLRWRVDELHETQTFKDMNPHGLPFDPRGFSGSPVFTTGSRRLLGHVTHFLRGGKGDALFTPIDETLRWADGLL